MNLFKEAQKITETHVKLTKYEEQVRKACERAKRTDNPKDLKEYLRMRSE